MREIDKGYALEAERPGIGHLLGRARQSQGVSLEGPTGRPGSANTTWSAWRANNHSAMPEPNYVCGFVKAYANYLGLDGDRFAAHISFWHERCRRTRRGPHWGNQELLRRLAG